MAGAVLPGELNLSRATGMQFQVAGESDDADIRRLLRETPMPGHISVSLEREPNYFAESHWPGQQRHTIVAKVNGQVACVGSCVVRKRYVNGVVRRVGYLGGLRLAGSMGGRFDIVRRGYQFFREVIETDPPDLLFTSVAADNIRARRFLERGLPGMPLYEYLRDYVTYLMAARHHHDPQLNSKPLEERCCRNDLVEHLNLHNRAYQFAPCWSVGEFAKLDALDLQAEDRLFVSQSDGVGCCLVWDQRGFKQIVIRGYAPWLSRLRPMINLLAGFLKRPRLPVLGSTVSCATVFQLTAQEDEPLALAQLLHSAADLAAARGVECLALGFAADDPRLAIVRQLFPGAEYRSRIYQISWPDSRLSRVELDGGYLQPELALL